VNRRDFSARLAGSGLSAVAASLTIGSFSGLASAQTGAPTEGKQFLKVDPPVPPIAPGKIEVLEFFSYACPHCNAFEPTIESWAAKVPADVAFRRVPVPFLMNYENYMRMYYTLETLGVVDTMQRKVFNSVHVDRQYLDKPADITAFVTKNGIDSAKFMSVFNSFSVASSVTRAKKLMADYKLDGVPTMAVQGHFVTSPGQAGGLAETMTVVDYLIQRARKA
jgi:thiol:disulfide interchange protein DsbA